MTNISQLERVTRRMRQVSELEEKAKSAQRAKLSMTEKNEVLTKPI